MSEPAAGSWRGLARDLAHTAVLTDFDGTLSAVVVDPEDARPIPGAAATLEDLARRAHTVAVVSGRPLDFLEAHFGPAVTLSGLYGLQTRTAGVRGQHPDAERWRSVVDATVVAAHRELPDDVGVEPKGLAVTLHYRSAPRRQAEVEAWAQCRSRATGLRVADSRRSVELNPPIEADKGTVVAALASQPGVRHACFLGDDRADLDAFAALDELRSAGLDTRSVAVRSSETPPEVLTGADEVVDGPQAAVALLQALLDPG